MGLEKITWEFVTAEAAGTQGDRVPNRWEAPRRALELELGPSGHFSNFHAAQERKRTESH